MFHSLHTTANATKAEHFKKYNIKLEKEPRFLKINLSLVFLAESMAQESLVSQSNIPPKRGYQLVQISNVIRIPQHKRLHQ